MKHKMSIIMSFMLVAAFAIPVLMQGEAAYAAGSIYVNDSQNVLSGDLSSAYAVGGTGSVSIVGGTYAITGDGVSLLGQSATTPTIPSGEADGTTVAISEQTVRVGLYYYYSTRNTAQPFANLQNKVGGGYKFGYYDSSRVFHELGSTNETMLTMVPDLNTAVNGGTVGCYHIKLLSTYNDFGSAQSVAAQYADGFPAYINGTYCVLVGNYQSAADTNTARVSLGITGDIFSGSSRCVAVTKTGTTKILFEFDMGTNENLAVRPVCTSSDAITWFKGYAYYGDFEYFRCVSDKLTVINVLDLEDYIKGVVPIEMSSSFPAEALKAQAVCARSYFMANLGGTYTKYGFDVTADTNSQAYIGTNRASTETDAAVEATRGEYVTYNGAVCSALYSSSDGGATENSENIFTNAIPYLRGVLDPFETDVPQTLNSYKSWHYEFTGAQLAAKLGTQGFGGGAIVSVSPQYSATGNVISLTLTDANGMSCTISKSGCYSVLGLPSVHYTIAPSPTTAGLFVIDGGGWGHNVGMSQWGAYSMAKNYGLNYRQIIRYYYTGVNISAGILS